MALAISPRVIVRMLLRHEQVEAAVRILLAQPVKVLEQVRAAQRLVSDDEVAPHRYLLFDRTSAVGPV
jgi:hypothetical protein